VHLIIAQRLGRRLCPECKRPANIPREALLKAGFGAEEIGTFTLYEPVGCENCNGGYRGRVGIYQVMPVSEPMGEIIMRGGNQLDLERQAQKDGVPDLRKSGLKKVKDGLMGLAEVEAVTNQ
jgi:type IV pilus assembly protein PilB